MAQKKKFSAASHWTRLILAVLVGALCMRVDAFGRPALHSFVQQSSVGPRHFALLRRSPGSVGDASNSDENDAPTDAPSRKNSFNDDVTHCPAFADTEKLVMTRCELMERISHLETIVSSMLQKSLETSDESVPKIPMNLIAKMKRKNEFIRFGKRSSFDVYEDSPRYGDSILD